MMRRPLLILVLLGLLATLSQAAPPTASPFGAPAGIGIDQHPGTQIPLDAVFRDESGRPVRLGDLLHGRPLVLALVYFNCPQLCTLVLNDLLMAVRNLPLEIGTQYDVLTVSFDPHDTPEGAQKKKANYVGSLNRFHPPASGDASPYWHFLTGDQPAIDQLTRAAGFRYTYDAKSGQYFHPAGLIILTPDGRIARYFYGINYDPNDLRLALLEASGGKVATITDQILLACYHYDPSTGRYTLAVQSLLRWGALVMLAVMGLGLAFLFRLDRRRTRRLAAVPPAPGGPSP